jgi:putative phosphoesterase
MPHVLIIADTHGFLDPRISELAEQCRWVVHAGDIGDKAIIDELVSKGPEVHMVRGNNDIPGKWAADQHDWLQQLPWTESVSLPGGNLIIEHGHRVNPAMQRHARLREKYPDAMAVVYGHSHRQVCDQDAVPWILNPGAAGRARTYGGGPACMLLHIGDRDWQIETQRFTPLRRTRHVVAG